MELSYEDIPPVAVTPVTYEELKVLTKAAQKVCSHLKLPAPLTDIQDVLIIGQALPHAVLQG